MTQDQIVQIEFTAMMEVFSVSKWLCPDIITPAFMPDTKHATIRLSLYQPNNLNLMRHQSQKNKWQRLILTILNSLHDSFKE